MRKIVLWFLSIFSVLALAIVIVPPFINLDRLKPQIQDAILAQTGIHATINGHVRLSLLGRATISANNVVLTEYTGGSGVDYVSFSVPIYKIFNLKTATIPNEITISGANLMITELSTPDFNNTLVIQNSSVTFMGHTYGDINGTLTHGMFSGTLRTDDHKYTFSIDHDKFVITNPNVNLNITGQMFVDNHGRISSAGTLTIDTDRINSWFAFDVPRITSRVAMSMKYEWQNMDFHFYDITGTMNDTTFSGDIKLSETGKKVKLNAKNLNFDLSFLLKNPEFLTNSEFDVDLAGDLLFRGRKFRSVRMVSSDGPNGVEIRSLAFSSDRLSGVIGGNINGDGANLLVNLTNGNELIKCDFTGTPEYWTCREWSVTSPTFSAFGKLSVTPETYTMSITSDHIDLDPAGLSELARWFGNRDASISFDFPDGVGIVDTNGADYTARYVADNTSLISVPLEFDTFLPNAMLVVPGKLDATITNGVPTRMTFVTNNWDLSFDATSFILNHKDALNFLKDIQPTIETKFLNPNIPLIISGKYNKPYLSDLVISVGGMEFTGLINGRAITLRTKLLDMDALINPEYVANYAGEQFLTTEPLTVPFTLPFMVTLSADYIRFDNNDYANFAYTLKGASQKMSITDETRGHILLTIDKELARYKMLVQVNRFAFRGQILNQLMPLNISNSMLTARAELITHGITVYDFWNNVRGDLDLTFEGGILHGIGTDWFYANARDITRLNMGDAVSIMLDGGDSGLKALHIIGRYENNDFETTEPFDLRMKHTEITGNLKLSNGQMVTHMDIILRGTSPYPETVYLDIFPDGTRDYSIFEISSKIDPDFLFNFITTHDRF